MNAIFTNIFYKVFVGKCDVYIESDKILDIGFFSICNTPCKVLCNNMIQKFCT